MDAMNTDLNNDRYNYSLLAREQLVDLKDIIKSLAVLEMKI